MKARRYTIILLTSIFLYACSNKAQEQQKENKVNNDALRTVKVVESRSINFNKQVYAIGRLASKEESKLSFKTGGIIKRIYASEGQTVGAGKILAELDMEEINAQVNKATVGQSQAEIQLNSAQLMVEKLERDFETVKALYEDKVATLTELKDTKSALDNAKNQVQAAEKGVALSRENQKVADYNKRLSKIIAPSSGIILKRLAEPNEIVGPGKPIFLFGSRNQALVLRVSVTDKDIIHLNIGAEASIQFDAYPNQTFTGVITEVAGIADPYTGTYEVEISLSSSNEKLLSGFIGEARIESSMRQKMQAIPIDAMISANGDQAKIFTVEKGMVKSKTIKIGPIRGTDLVVMSGLTEGEQVITKGANYVSPNDSVQTTKQ